jgi:hypothetical protein
MATDNHLKKLLLRILIVSLSVSALTGIIIFLLGKFGDTEEKILLTTVAVGASSLLGLCCATVYPNIRLKLLGTTGVILSAIALVYTLVLIWGKFDNRLMGQLYLSLILWTATIAHICLLLLITCANSLVKKVLTTTIVCILIVSTMLSVLIWADKLTNEFFFRLLGVFAILDALGTIVTPILNKAQRIKE